MEQVVVTGYGVVSPIGHGPGPFWERLIAGTHGFKEVSSFDTSAYKVNVGAEIHDFDLSHFTKKDASSLGRATQFALAAASLAIENANLHDFERDRAGVVMGTTSGEPNLIEDLNDAVVEARLSSFGDQFLSEYPCHHIPGYVASHFGFKGFAPVMIPAACAAGNYAIARAFDMLQSGRADVMLAGGSDSFSRITYSGFARIMAISPDLCRPFDKNRQGMIPGEGSGMLILETLSHAKARGARIYAEITGYGLSCDAHHMTAGHPEGLGAAKAMEMALREAKLTPKDVDYICAHGTGTRSNDLNETTAVKKVFGDLAYKIPISSIKSMLGHTMGAASAIEAAVCSLVVSENIIPPTMHLETPDPECDLDYVPGTARKQEVNVVMSNAYAFGGANGSVIFKKYKG